VRDDVLKYELPLHLEGVVVNALVRHAGPAVLVVDRAVDVGIPDAARRGGEALGLAVAQAGDGGAVGAVNVQGEQVVAIDAGGPGGVEVEDGAVVQLEGRVGGVVGGALVFLAGFVPTLGDVGGAEAGEALDVAEEVLDVILPVADHVHDDAAVVFLAV